MFTAKMKKKSSFLIVCAIILGAALIGALQASLPTAYQVPSTEEAKQFVEDLIKQAKAIANNPQAGQEDFGDLLEKNAVTEEISKFVLGSHARSMNAQQLKEFQEVYKKRLITIYSTPEKLKNFKNTTSTVEAGAAKQSDGTMLVKTSFKFNENSNGEPARVYWKIVKKNGQLYIFDILFEGISKLLTERQEYKAIFMAKDKGNNNPKNFLDYLKREIAKQ